MTEFEDRLFDLQEETRYPVRMMILSQLVDDDGQAHYTKHAHRAMLERTERGVVLDSDEEQDGERLHLTLTCEPGKATMKRKGEVCALLHFEEGKRVEGRYITAYGDIHIATDTRFVRLSTQPQGGKLTLNYAVYAGGDKTSDAQLEIQWRR